MTNNKNNRDRHHFLTRQKNFFTKNGVCPLKAQSILEYILVSFVFTTVGIGAFVAANMGGFFAKHGTAANYHSKDTLIGQTLENGVDDSTQEWPQDWQDDAPEPEIAEWDGVEDDAEFLEGVEGYDGFSEYEH